MASTTPGSWLGHLRHGHFSAADDGLHDPDGTLIDFSLMDRLDEAREQLGVFFQVTSGFRPPAVNAAAGGAEHSAHLPDPVTRQGCAVDGTFVGVPLIEQLAHLQCFHFLGIGLYPHPLPGRDPTRPWTPVVHVDRKDRQQRFNATTLWIRNRAGLYVYSPSAEFKAELHTFACTKETS